MPDPFSKEVVGTVLTRLGYVAVAEQPGQVVYQDSDTGHYLTIAFNNDHIDWDDLSANLEYEGINLALFLAEYEAL